MANSVSSTQIASNDGLVNKDTTVSQSYVDQRAGSEAGKAIMYLSFIFGALIGGVIGFALGGPFGAFIGGAVGGMVGSFFFPALGLGACGIYSLVTADNVDK